MYPFILNGVSLLGVGSAGTPVETRNLIWEKLSSDWNMREKIPAIAREATLDELKDKYLDAILEGKIVGRIVVKV